MSRRVTVSFATAAVVALDLLLAGTCLADPDAEERWPRLDQASENRWVPSLGLRGGAIFQDHSGFSSSQISDGVPPDPEELRPARAGDEFNVGPLLGVSLELMAPALPVPTRPRFFVSGEFLPIFSSARSVSVDGDVDCIRGREPAIPCARDEDGSRLNGRAFNQFQTRGAGSRTEAEYGPFAFGASLGVAFPAEFAGRRLRIKPSFGWIHYEVRTTGHLSSAPDCVGRNEDGTPRPAQCTDTQAPPSPFPGLPPGPGRFGYLREVSLTGGGQERFNALGPGLDLEVDVGRFGPIGAALFLGANAYRNLGERTIEFSAGPERFFLVSNSQGVLGGDPGSVAEANFRVEVDPWLYRAHVGIRFQWLGGWQ